MAAMAGLSLTTKSCRSRHFEFHFGTKNLKIVEDHPMNIHVQFSFNHIGFPIDIKNIELVEDLPMIIPGQFGLNFHWMVLYKLYVFCSDMKFKMAVTARLNLKPDPIRKKFSKAFFLKTPSYRNKKRKVCRGPSNEHSSSVWL
jgi:hypothetical protein